MLPDRSLPVAALVLSAALGGCALFAPPPAPEPPPPPPPPPVAEPAPAPPPPEPAPPVPTAEQRRAEAADAALAYADRMRAATPAELQQEIARLATQPEPLRGPLGEVQLAVALAQTHVPADGVRAQAALQRVLGSNGAAAQALHPFARFLSARLAEQKRTDDALDRQSAQLRDQQRRIDQLNERLEAVRALERSLTTRGARPPAPP